MTVRYRTRLTVLLAQIQREQRRSAVPFSLFNSEQMCYTQHDVRTFLFSSQLPGKEAHMDRVIFHCDLNCFYASVELLSHPELRELSNFEY